LHQITIPWICPNRCNCLFANKFFVELDLPESPLREVDLSAIEVMREVGIDISKQRPIITEDMFGEPTVMVNMGCMDKNSCPTLFLHNVIDWDIEESEAIKTAEE
jgi:arsenate reductase (thioredoxin)